MAELGVASIEPRRGYLLAVAAGRFSVSKARTAFRKVLRAAAESHHDCVLVDWLAVRGEVSSAQLKVFAKFITDEHTLVLRATGSPSRIAILARPPFTGLGAPGRGSARAGRRASENVEELLLWLADA